MNKNFEWSRFCKVVRKDFNNIWPQAGTTLLIITLLPIAIWLLWWVIMGLSEDVPFIAPEVRWYMIAVVELLVCIVTPSRLYRTCNLQKEGIYFAMLPASKLEKYLSMLLFSILVCPLLCLVGGIVLDYFLTLLPFGPYSKWLWQTDYLAQGLDGYRALVAGAFYNDEVDTLRLLADVFTPGRIILIFILNYLNSVALYMFTNTIFKKHKVLQTILWTMLINFALNIIATPIMGAVMMNGNWVEEIMNWSAPVSSLNAFFWISTAWNAVLTAVFFWWAGYRLKHMKY